MKLYILLYVAKRRFMKEEYITSYFKVHFVSVLPKKNDLNKAIFRPTFSSLAHLN